MAKNIRNFSIIAHIDHGKSTLADRMLEATSTIEKRKMQDQVLDRMDLERERGITIKMTPVTMNHNVDGEDYTLNLIDTPGHIDFSYEVSRALRAVEGTIMLVDSTQGVQAQTFTTLDMAREIGLKIIPVLSKVDSPLARVDEIKEEVAQVLGPDHGEIYLTSGKTGEGVKELLDKIVSIVEAPKKGEDSLKALVFDFQYSNHKGVVVYVRVMNGSIKKNDKLQFSIAGKQFSVNEVGVFRPDETPVDELGVGEIGYIVTGIKEPGVARVGDTIIGAGLKTEALSGYQDPRPVIWASVYPESQDDFMLLKQSLEKLNLSDSSLSYEEESSGVLGRGFRCGFLGMLHLEIITERLRREFKLNLVVTTPSITYNVVDKKGQEKEVYSPSLFPHYSEIAEIKEQWVKLKLITPREYISGLMQVLFEHEGAVVATELFGDGRTSFTVDMPLRELMRNFFDDVKRVSSGYGSISYEIGEDLLGADVVLLEVLVAEEVIPAFTRVVARRRMEEEAKKIVGKLYELLPRQLFKTKIQAQALGRVLSSKTLSAMQKDVAGYLYGGDITRKMKLREKQKKGKKKMQARAKANIPHEVFLKMIKDSD